MTLWVLVTVVAEVNVVSHELKCIWRHCILYVWNCQTIWSTHPNFSLVSIISKMPSTNDQNNNPCNYKSDSNFVFCFFIVGSMKCSVRRFVFLEPTEMRDKEGFLGLISIGVKSLLLGNPFFVGINMCHLCYVLEQFDCEDGEE